MQIYNNVMEYLREFTVVTAAIRIALAVIIGATLGYERERYGRAAGLRTHVLVCLGAAIATLIGHYNSEILGFTADPMRIGAQVVSGIGFLGVGTILSKGRFQVTGLTTAAGLWTTAAIGLAVGIGFYEGAILGAICAVLTMTLFAQFDSHIIKKNRKLRLYVELNDVNQINTMIDIFNNGYGAHDTQVTAPRSGIAGNVGIEVSIITPDGVTQVDVLERLRKREFVVFAIHSI